MSEHRTTLHWVRSTFCGNNTCVEVARTPRTVHVRDSKDPEGRQLVLPVDVWREFVERVKRGDLDHT
jgi:Domain of unknown function (DUF397)